MSIDNSFNATIAAARRAGVSFVEDSPPTSHSIRQNGEFDLNFVDWGDPSRSNPTIIFIHGFMQQARTWDFTCLALRSRFRCISLDLRGHGDSDRPAAPDYTTHHYLRDLHRLTYHLKGQMSIDRFGLCGLSLGGHLSYIYASQNPQDVNAVVVVDVAPEMNREARRGINRYISALPQGGPFEELVEKVAKMSPMRTRSAIEGSLLRATRFRSDGEWEWKHDPRLLEHHRATYSANDYWAALSNVSAPTMFVLGRNSKLVSPETVRRMVEIVPGSSATYVPNASHRVPGDNPLGFIKAVTLFFDRYMPKHEAGRRHDARQAPT